MTDNLFSKIAFTKLPYIGSNIGRMLIEKIGSIEEIFELSHKEIEALNLTPTVTKSLKQHKEKAFHLADQELTHIDKNDVSVAYFEDEEYPQRLNNFNNTPLLLYYKGNANLNMNRSVGIIGTRKASHQGIHFTEQLVEDLQNYHVNIISGLAYGIDIASHRKSVELGIPTIGVCGHGLGMIYPSAHRKTAYEMLEDGAVLTEFAFDDKPLAERFPARNRIVAALSDAIVVVESPKSGGSLITCKYANDYNKDVFAVPGRPSDENAAGCNHLIKSHQAQLISSAEDIAYIMRWNEMKHPVHKQQGELFLELSENEKNMISLLKNNQNLSIDNLANKLQKRTSEIASIALALEFKGVLKPVPGNRYLLL